MLKFKNSGYQKKFRKEVLDSIMKGFEKMKENDNKTNVQKQRMEPRRTKTVKIQ